MMKIFNVLRGSFHDGPGIRTVVYFKGCNLACRWCHNPEGISAAGEILYNEELCIKCGWCKQQGAEGYKNCPSGALSICGTDMTTDQVFSEIVKDMHYFKRSGGGVTLSGGEVLLQHEAAAELLKKCKENKINTVVETAFHSPWHRIEAILGYTDLFLIDLKHSDTAVHKKYTGKGNETILENLKRVSTLNKDITVRIPLIPGINDDDINLVETSKIVNGLGEGVRKLELLKYNNLADKKYSLLNTTPNLEGFFPQTDAEMDGKRALMQAYMREGIEVV